MGQSTPSFWDAIRAWADSAGLLLPQEASEAQNGPTVPKSVCDNCPICQGAATLDQVNPEVIAELADVARNVLTGMGSALAAAAEQRLTGSQTVPGEATDASADSGERPPGAGRPGEGQADAGDGRDRPDGADGQPDAGRPDGSVGS